MEPNEEYDYENTADIDIQISKDIQRLQDRSRKSEKIRVDLSDKLEKIVMGITIGENDNAKVLAAKAMLIDSLTKSLDTIESSQREIIKLKQKMKSKEDDANTEAIVNKTVTALLSSIKNTTCRTLDDGSKLCASIDEVLDAEVGKRNIVATDGELEIGAPAVDISAGNSEK